jgi:hypothetical protein
LELAKSSDIEEDDDAYNDVGEFELSWYEDLELVYCHSERETHRQIVLFGEL